MKIRLRVYQVQGEHCLEENHFQCATHEEAHEDKGVDGIGLVSKKGLISVYVQVPGHRALNEPLHGDMRREQLNTQRAVFVMLDLLGETMERSPERGQVIALRRLCNKLIYSALCQTPSTLGPKFNASKSGLFVLWWGMHQCIRGD